MKKLIAGFMTALMALLTVVSPVLASTVADYPTFLAEDHTLGAYVVVGSDAATSDVVGAVDLAIRLAELSYTLEVVPGAEVAEFTGLVRDGIAIGASATSTLATAVSGGTAFPSGVILKYTHYSGLEDSTFTWRSINYDYHERVDASGVYMRHLLTANYINGTEKMVVGTNGAIKYEYVFDKQLTGTGSVSSPNYTYPIDIYLLGKKFTIVGVDADSILMLTGSVCTGVTATSPCEYGDYSVYATLGGTNFVRLQIKDADGNTVAEDTAVGSSGWTTITKTFDSLSLDVTITAISALTDGTVVGVNMVVGPTGTTTHDYDATADVESTGSSNEAFPGASRWGIQFSATGCSDGTIGVGSKIQVTYLPSDIQYLVAGEKISLPNDYGDLKFEGFNTDNFATITMKPYGAASVYNSSDKLVQSGMYGLEIASDTAGVLKAGGDYYTKGYLLFNASKTGQIFGVVIGYYDSVKGHIYVSDGWAGNMTTAATENVSYGGKSTDTKYGFGKLNATAGTKEFSYAFTLNNGEEDFYVNVTVDASSTSPINMTHAGDAATDTNISIGFHNATSWVKTDGSKFDTDFIKLGATASSAEATELNVTTEGTVWQNAGSKEIAEIVDDDGLIFLHPKSHGGSDRVMFKVPSKALAVKASFGKAGAVTTEEGTYHKIVPVTSAVAKLDTEMSALKTAKHVVLVGGPCVNDLVAELATAGKFDYTCDTWPGRNFGLIKVIDDAFATGKVAVVVAGTRADDTRVACSALQLYDTKLAGKAVASVEVTGTVGAPVVS